MHVGALFLAGRESACGKECADALDRGCGSPIFFGFIHFWMVRARMGEVRAP
jgi:hypothetical protein